MAFNKTELANMLAMHKEVRFAWVRGLDRIEGAPVVAALAQMLEFGDTWELALSFLENRKSKYPKPVAQQVLYSLKRHDEPRRYQMGLQTLKGIKKVDLDAAMDAVRNTAGWASDEWDRFLKKVRRDLKKI